MKKNYTRKQIAEAIKYWHDQLQKKSVDEAIDVSRLGNATKQALRQSASGVKTMKDVQRVISDYEKNSGKIDAKLRKQATSSGRATGDSIMNLVKDMYEFLKDVVTLAYKCSWFTVAVVAGVLVYLLSPIDAIPDFIPVAGQLDDVGVVLFAFKLISDEFSEWRKWKYGSDESGEK